MGIRNKILAGIVLIGVLLMLSGTISSIELANLNSDTAERIKSNEQTLVLTKKLLDVAQQKNTAIFHSIKDTLDVYDSIAAVSDLEFDKTLLILKNRDKASPMIQHIEAANYRYRKAFVDCEKMTDMQKFWDVYPQTYFNLTRSIKDYMISEQDKFLQYTTVLESNVYRALMIGIISFASGLFLLVMFYFMINHFLLRPVLRMEKAVKEKIKMNIPYNVKVESNDEIMDLSSGINELCSKYKKD